MVRMLHSHLIALGTEERAVLEDDGEGPDMKRNAVRWLSAAALSLVMLGSRNMGRGSQVPGAAWAVEPGQVPMSSLAPEEIRGLQEGEGIRLARAAELNGYPGPAHILEAARAGKIELYADQRQAIERIHAAMKAKAQALGRQILAQEVSLEAGFRTGRVVEADLARQVEDIARLLAELRLTHLRAHLMTAAILRPQQIEEYYQFRGYSAPSSGRHLGH